MKSTSLVMGKHSGRHAFREKLTALGFELGDNALQDAFRRFKDLADRKKHVFDEDIEALVEDEMAQAGEAIRLVALTVIAGTGGPPKAIVTLDVDGQHITKEATGDGPVDAMFKAVRAIAPHEAKLQLYQVGAVTEDSDAQAEVSVRLERGRQDRHRPRRRYRHHDRLGQGLCLGGQQAGDPPHQVEAGGS